MKKTLLFLPVLLMLLFAVSLSGEKVGPRPENLPFIIGSEPFPDVPYCPSQPGMTTDSPGEIVGGTQYDYQSNGSSGRRIALDSQGGIHVAWMNGITYPTTRHIYYNYKNSSGTWLVPGVGTSVSQASGAGYNQLELTSDDRAVVAYHQWQVSPWAVVAIDAFSGFGIFNYYDPPDFTSGVRCYWPYVSVDVNENIHVLVNEQAINAGDPHILAYTMSTDNGDSWSALVEADTLMTLSAIVVSSPVSDKVAIAYAHPQNFDTQWENDVYYIESVDGMTWDWRFGKVDVTNYGAPDSLFAYIDIDAIYDYNDNLHLIWNAQWVTDAGVYYKTYLFHYSTGSQTIIQMHETPETWPAGCAYGVWNRAVTKMSLAVDYNALFAVYTGFDTTDCSAGGYANGDLYMQQSINGGISWTSPLNITNSQTPGCAPGDCDSDHWASMADEVNGLLHITYINDKDAGGIAQTEGSVTDNPVMYLEYDPIIVGIDEDEIIPESFSLGQNYPNPFNAATQIEFGLEGAAQVNLSIYDITGAKVTTLIDGFMESGTHSVIWDASNNSSGIYYYTLRAEGESTTHKMTLIK